MTILTRVITLHLRQCGGGMLKPLSSAIHREMPNGLAILEGFDANHLVPIEEGLVSGAHLGDRLIAARFFGGGKQVKLRRITDADFWVAADFPLAECRTVSLEYSSEVVREMALWGYHSEQMGEFLYEERIPWFFRYPCEAAFSEKERCAVALREYRDEAGRPVWDRFETLKKWRG